MANFAPAYHHESNTQWLNELVDEIIEPAQRANCRNYGRDWDDDMVDAEDSGEFDPDKSEAHQGQSAHRQTTSSPPTNGPIQGQSIPPRTWSARRSRMSQASTTRASASSPTSQLFRTLSGRHRRSESSNARQQKRRSQAAVSLMSDRSASPFPICEEDSRTRALSDAPMVLPNPPVSAFSDRSIKGKSRDMRQLRLSGISARQIPDTPAPPYDEVVQKPKALHRSFSQQGWSRYEKSGGAQLKRQNSTLSAISEFSGFPSHPGVRPFDHRKVLGEAAGKPDGDEEYPAPLPLTLIIIGVCLSVFVISLDRNIITTVSCFSKHFMSTLTVQAIPQITAKFHSYSDIGWYGAAYLLTASAFQPLFGRIYMSFETKSTFLGALGVFELGSLLAALAPSSKALIVGRAVQGLGSAGILTGSFVVSTHVVRMQTRPILFAGVGILYAVGALAGPLLGGAFTDTIGWRWCFWINLPVGAVTFATVFMFFKKSTLSKTKARPKWIERMLKLDFVGNVILLSAAIMLFLALQYSEQRYSWSSARVVGLLVGFGLTVVIFIAWLWYKGDDALLPLKIITQRTVAASCGAAFFIYGTTLLHAYYLPIWFQAIKGASAVHSGINMIPYMCANALLGLIAGIFVSKNGLFAPPAIIGCAIGTIGCGFLATMHANTSTATWVGYEILASAGIGMAIQQGFSAVQTALPLEQVPIGTAAVVASQSAGGAIFVSVGNTLLQNHLLSKNNANSIPGVDIRTIIEQGATNFRQHVPAEALPPLIHLYNRALQGVFIAAVPLCGLAFICSLCMEFRSVRKGEVKQKMEKDVQFVEKETEP